MILVFIFKVYRYIVISINVSDSVMDPIGNLDVMRLLGHLISNKASEKQQQNVSQSMMPRQNINSIEEHNIIKNGEIEPGIIENDVICFQNSSMVTESIGEKTTLKTCLTQTTTDAEHRKTSYWNKNLINSHGDLLSIHSVNRACHPSIEVHKNKSNHSENEQPTRKRKSKYSDIEGDLSHIQREPKCARTTTKRSQQYSNEYTEPPFRRREENTTNAEVLLVRRLMKMLLHPKSRQQQECVVALLRSDSKLRKVFIDERRKIGKTTIPVFRTGMSPKEQEEPQKKASSVWDNESSSKYLYDIQNDDSMNGRQLGQSPEPYCNVHASTELPISNLLYIDREKNSRSTDRRTFETYFPSTTQVNSISTSILKDTSTSCLPSTESLYQDVRVFSNHQEMSDVHCNWPTIDLGFTSLFTSTYTESVHEESHFLPGGINTNEN